MDWLAQKFVFSFGEEDSMDKMKRLIIEEVQSFRAEVRQQARATGQIKRQDGLPISSRDEIISSPVREYGPIHGATSGLTAPSQRPPSPIMDDPSDALEQELAGTHIGRR
ncbi:hypothetical protein K503DRAFT_805407 [Rhizopogon vinicolor AM-OR11-026]|uniref:Uncharacterized protein n=1 Tax=Rhizopogon vinicolor AM-OR11-026 TaxID=1314800 RepID=A0A1B7MHW2_9AGAM|nr:hypothetical protein K503DRAFT_805407 [Rhizopogon vinicolor AM-OR11-026]